MLDITRSLKDLLLDYSPGNVEKHLVDIECAIALIENYNEALRFMVYQYCTREGLNSEYFDHSYMSAGETAFEVLGIHNGDEVPKDWLWPEREDNNSDNDQQGIRN